MATEPVGLGPPGTTSWPRSSRPPASSSGPSSPWAPWAGWECARWELPVCWWVEVGLVLLLYSHVWYGCGGFWPLGVHRVVALPWAPWYLQSGQLSLFPPSAPLWVWDHLELYLHCWPSVALMDWKPQSTFVLCHIGPLQIHCWWPRSGLISPCLLRHWMLNSHSSSWGTVLIAGTSPLDPSGPASLWACSVETSGLPWPNLLKCSYWVGKCEVVVSKQTSI